MDERTKKVVLITLCSVGMGLFLFLEFYYDSYDKFDSDGFVNPATLDSAPSKQDIYSDKRKKDRKEFNYDRKVASLDDFLKNQINKDPFEPDTSGMIEEAEVIEDVQQKEIVETPMPEKTNKSLNSNIRSSTGDADAFAETQTIKPKRRVGFVSGGNESTDSSVQTNNEPNGINALAVVQENSLLKSGATLRLRIINSFEIGNVHVPNNTFVSGRVSFSNDRIFIDVKTITVNEHLLAVKLSAYDMNGNKGLLVQGGLEKEIKGDALEQTVNEIQRNVKVPILRNVPFSSAKKKIREPEVPISAGHRLYLKSQ